MAEETADRPGDTHPHCDAEGNQKRDHTIPQGCFLFPRHNGIHAVIERAARNQRHRRGDEDPPVSAGRKTDADWNICCVIR